MHCLVQKMFDLQILEDVSPPTQEASSVLKELIKSEVFDLCSVGLKLNMYSKVADKTVTNGCNELLESSEVSCPGLFEAKVLGEGQGSIVGGGQVLLQTSASSVLRMISQF